MVDQKEADIPQTSEAQMVQLERFFNPEAGGKLAESDLVAAGTKLFGDRARVAATPLARADLSSTAEVTPEVLAECLAGLESDYKRGIVVVDDKGTVADFKAALKRDKTAGISWKQMQERLIANDSALLKKAAELQGKGTLIGVYLDGEPCIKDRGNEPVIYGKDKEGRPVKITTDTPDRSEVMRNVASEGQFADYWEIRSAVHAEGFELPLDSPNFEKKGFVAAVEAVTGQNFIRSTNSNEWRSAILECGDVSRYSDVRVVFFSSSDSKGAYVRDDDPENRSVRGAVRVLRVRG